jgi:anti-sigma B factor antagonist
MAAQGESFEFLYTCPFGFRHAALVYPVPMPIETRRMEPGVAVVALSGRMTFGRDAEQFESTVRKLIENGDRKFVLDATALEYIDSAGIGALVSALSSVKKAGGELRLAGATERIVRLFAMTGVDKLLSLYPTVAEAASA